MYGQNGYAYIHNWVANKVLQKVTNNSNASIVSTLVPFKSDAYVSDSFGKYVLTDMLPIFLRLIYIIPLYRLVQNMVGEKETRARESMRMMGLSDSSYWLSWFSYYFIIVTVISLLCLIVTSGNVWVHSSKGIIFLFLWLYGLSLFGLSLFV